MCRGLSLMCFNYVTNQISWLTTGNDFCYYIQCKKVVIFCEKHCLWSENAAFTVTFWFIKNKIFKILPIVTLRECYHQRPENPVNFLKTMLIEFLGTSLVPFSLISQLVKRSEIAPVEREKWKTWVGSRMKGNLGLKFFTRPDPTQISLIFSFLCYYRAVCYRVLRCKRSAWNRL